MNWIKRGGWGDNGRDSACLFVLPMALLATAVAMVKHLPEIIREIVG